MTVPDAIAAAAGLEQAMDYSKPLPNQRHEKFVLGLLEGKADTKAYEDAGYKPDHRNAGRMTTNDDIQGRLTFLQSQVAKEAVIDAAWVTKRLVENVERSMQAVEVTDAAGIGTGVYTYQGAVANKALELLGRNIGMFKDAPPVQVNVNLPGDESSFADRLAARRKGRANGETRLHWPRIPYRQLKNPMIVVNDTWRIGADEHQWIVYRASGVAKKDQRGGKAGETIWKPKAYFEDPGDAALFVARGHHLI